jgi:hypothetical protein
MPIGKPAAPRSLTSKTQSLESLRNARIGFNNLLTATTTSGAEVMLLPNTYERYLPGAGAVTIKFQMSVSASIDFVGIAAHNAFSESVDITVAYATSVGGSLTTIDTISFVDDGAYMLLFNTVTAREIAITFTGTAALELGVVSAGLSLQMQRSIYGGHSPIDLSANTEYQSVTSDTGQFLGRSITRKGVESNYSWQFLDPDWIRSDFLSFMESAKTKPFFLKWKPSEYDKAVYGYADQDIKPQNMGGGHGLMSVSFTVKGHSE